MLGNCGLYCARLVRLALNALRLRCVTQVVIIDVVNGVGYVHLQINVVNPTDFLCKYTKTAHGNSSRSSTLWLTAKLSRSRAYIWDRTVTRAGIRLLKSTVPKISDYPAFMTQASVSRFNGRLTIIAVLYQLHQITPTTNQRSSLKT
ncbi:hypothetical protein T265_06676 [Opisthorchis viverrini]|uniref:Uncharacterized protein n=1 Tax=Opisthorchis viverrini TaxID=6198 RepID=A0A074ZFL7_OPIVI|nr:hypothetical protein T265_06676 [Opisthorchis viverrini]KER25983.1 hypothetical protein T265_06676 [Opisthorchis viverrini]